MIGLVLVAHDEIADEMLKAIEHVAGPQGLTAAMTIQADEDVDQCKKRLTQLIERCDGGDGVLLLADMFGGTPCNLALACMQKGRVEVLSGFNLPMLIKAATLRQSITDVRKLAEQARDAGRYHMHLASELLEEGKEDA